MSHYHAEFIELRDKRSRALLRCATMWWSISARLAGREFTAVSNGRCKQALLHRDGNRAQYDVAHYQQGELPCAKVQLSRQRIRSRRMLRLYLDYSLVQNSDFHLLEFLLPRPAKPIDSSFKNLLYFVVRTAHDYGMRMDCFCRFKQ